MATAAGGVVYILGGCGSEGRLADLHCFEPKVPYVQYQKRLLFANGKQSLMQPAVEQLTDLDT